MATPAPAVVGVEVERVVGNGPTLLHPMRAFVLGRRALHKLSVRIFEDLRSVVFGDLIPFLVVLDDVLLAWILHIPVRLPAPHDLRRRRSRVGSERGGDATCDDHRANACCSNRHAQTFTFHVLLRFLPCNGPVMSFPAFLLVDYFVLAAHAGEHGKNPSSSALSTQPDELAQAGDRASPGLVDMRAVSLCFFMQSPIMILSLSRARHGRRSCTASGKGRKGSWSACAA